jgi:hypothetical protein
VGLRRIVRRLESALVQPHGFDRRGARGDLVDGKLFRVVGTEASPDRAGTIAKVVRSAIVRGDEIVRVGEVIAYRKEAT